MKQYVSLLEAVCESSPATGDVVQDVSVIFAKLGKTQMISCPDQVDVSDMLLSLGQLINVKCLFTESRIKTRSWTRPTAALWRVRSQRHVFIERVMSALVLLHFMVLTEMVSRKRVFPTKTSGWVTLAHKPMIADSANLEKIFKSHSSVCLLNLPSAAKRAAGKSKNEGNVFLFA